MNPFKTVEKVLKFIGLVFVWLIVLLAVGVAFVAVPIYGIANGEPWYKSFAFYLIFLGVGAFSLVWAVISGLWENFFMRWWDRKRWEWDDRNRT